MSSGTSYADALAHLAALGPELVPGRPELAPSRPDTPAQAAARHKFDLAHMRVLLSALGNPQESFRSILIAGTNGKGSTAATLASILAAAGHPTALYTSPHLVRPNERIAVTVPLDPPSEYTSLDAPATLGPLALEPIPDDDFARLYFQVEAAAHTLVAQHLLPHPPSFFERLTALAFLFFAERHIQLAVLEVGLGGRLDATNTVTPILSLLTDIALDHQAWLGSTLTEITREKAGILRPEGTLITLPQHPEVNQALGEIAATLPHLRALSAADFIPPAPRPDQASPLREPRNPLLPGTTPATCNPQPTTPLPPNRYTVDFAGEPLHVDSPLPGSHQQRNLALALAAALELRGHHAVALPLSAIEAGIRNTRWPGRLESLPDPHLHLLLDVAHNPAGAWTLRSALAALPSSQPRTLLFSCLADKDLAELAQILFPLFDSSSSDPDRHHDHIVLAPISNPRAAPVADLLAQAHRLQVPAHAAPHLAAALDQARAVTPPGGLLLITGSVYLVGEARHLLLTTAPPASEPTSFARFQPVTQPHPAAPPRQEPQR